MCLTKQKEVEKVNEMEKEILKAIEEALPHMSEFDKGYFLGVAENKVAERRERELQEA